MKKKIVHVSHFDSDGIGCTVLSSYYGTLLGYDVVPYNVGYSKVAETLVHVLKKLEENAEDVAMFLISDISMREDSGIDKMVQALHESHPHILIQLLDHHASANWLNKYSWAFVQEKDEDDVKHCGTYLVDQFYKQMLPISIPANSAVDQLVEWTDLYDTWRWVEDYPTDEPFNPANDLNRLMLFKGVAGQSQALLARLVACSTGFPVPSIQTPYGDNYLFTQSDFDILAFSDKTVEDLIEAKDKEMITGSYTFRINSSNHLAYVESYFRNLYETEKEAREAISKFKLGYKKQFKVGVVYCEKNVSELGNALAKRHPELDFICLINMPSTVSYRCVKDLDVPLGIIANDFSRGKGGGHPKSSGSTISNYITTMVTGQLLPGFITSRR